MEEFSFGFDLVKTYAINFAYMLLRAILYAVSCFFSWIVINRMARINLMKEVTENKNLGASIIIGSLLLGLAYIFGQM